MDNLDVKYTLSDILTYINSGIEMATWFNDFLFVTISKEGIIIAGIKGSPHGSHELLFINILDDISEVVECVESFFDKKVKVIYDDKELKEETDYIFTEENTSLKDESFMLSVVIIPSNYDDFWIELFFDNGKEYEKYGFNDDILESVIYEFGIRELALHKNLDECVDHMLLFFGCR